MTSTERWPTRRDGFSWTNSTNAKARLSSSCAAAGHGARNQLHTASGLPTPGRSGRGGLGADRAPGQDQAALVRRHAIEGHRHTLAHSRRKGTIMRINLTGVFVDDQQKALRFYTEMLGFQKKTEVPVGDLFWLTVVSPEEPDGTELLLEPDTHPAVKPYKTALVEDGIPGGFLRRRGRPGRVRAAVFEGCTVHPAPGRPRHRGHGRAGRHLWQPDSNR